MPSYKSKIINTRIETLIQLYHVILYLETIDGVYQVHHYKIKFRNCFLTFILSNMSFGVNGAGLIHKLPNLLQKLNINNLPCKLSNKY